MDLFTRVGLMAAFREIGHWKSRKDDGKLMYESAAYRARELQRPLAIVGDVSDATPPGVKVFSPEDPTAIRAGDNSCVVLCSFSLEKTRDIDSAWKEISRVSGSPFNIFVAHVRGGIASLSPWVRWDIEHAPPRAPTLKYTPRYSPYPRD